MSSTVLAIRDVHKAFPHRSGQPLPVLAGMSLRVGTGEIVGLVGRSGVGKSTLASLIFGLEPADAGEILFADVDLVGAGRRVVRDARRQMHLVMQDPYQSLHPGLRVATAVGEPLAIAGVPRADRAARVLAAVEEVGLHPAGAILRRYPHELSGGQRQRVALARALVARPTLVVADEPTSMLDASLRAGVLEVMTGMRDRLGTAFLLITHDLAVARHVCDRIVVMDEGRVVEEGASDMLVSSAQHPVTRLLLAAARGDVFDSVYDSELREAAP